MSSAGWNPRFGVDQGQRPPYAPFGMPPNAHGQFALYPPGTVHAAAVGMPFANFAPGVGMGGMPFPPPPPQSGIAFGPVPSPAFAYAAGPGMAAASFAVPPPPPPPGFAIPVMPGGMPMAVPPGFPGAAGAAPMFVQPAANGTATLNVAQPPFGAVNVGPGGPRFPTNPFAPLADPDMPALNLTNSTGGVGCEPGYNYFFPAEHCKVHVLKSALPPWQVGAATRIPFIAAHVPCRTTAAEILKGFGATGPTPKKNRCYEVVAAGNGRWYKGLSFSAEDLDVLSKQILDFGWDASRGRPGPGGKKEVVLWFTKG